MKSACQLFIILLLLSLTSPTNIIANEEVIQKDNYFYMSNMVVLKLKEAPASVGDGKIDAQENIIDALKPYGASELKLRFTLQERTSKEAEELQKIILVEYDSPFDPEYVSAKLSNHPLIEWAEPRYLDKIDFTPNDPSYSSQYALDKIQAEQAWDINKGDASIIIAINDTGVDWDHPDLADNIWLNDDPIDGIDNDGNGYIDDLHGWDFGGLTGTPDNNPSEDRPDHGTHVAGISSAVTNNGVGVSSIGFNCTIMPVKTSQDNIRFGTLALISHGYEGIIYAADNGAHVINCSWGGLSYSIANQEVINYAVSKGVLVVGASGNDNSSDVIYPAAYRGALSVGSTTSSDSKSSFSNYGIKLDVLAPGSGIFSTWQNDTYTNLSGTSMASPCAAGLAGLVFNQFPSYTPLQVAEQIRATSDNIDGVNPGLEHLLGRGRINANSALTVATAKSVRIENYSFIDEGDGDGVLEPGENVSIQIDFLNYLNPTSNLSITASTSNSNITFINSGFSAGAVGTLQSFNNNSNKFQFSISPSISLNSDVNFLIEFSDGSYSDFQWVSGRLNPSYATQSVNNIALTITSKGSLGFDDFLSNQLGSGFSFDEGPNLLFEGAFLYGVSSTQLMDAARINDEQSTDFSTVLPFTINTPGTIADQQGLTKFNDNGAGSSKLGVETELHSYSFTDQQFENFIILKYILKNNSGGTISGLRTGLFFDWDFLDGFGTDDITRYDNTDGFAYAYHEGENPDPYVGAVVLSSSNNGYYGILNPGGSGSYSIYDQFTDAEKWTALSSGIQNTSLPAEDISFVISSEPIDIPSGQQKEVAFALAAGENLENLKNVIQSSRSKYNLLTDIIEDNSKIPTQYLLRQNYPNPFNPTTKISYEIPEDGLVTLRIYDVLGNEIVTLVNEQQNSGRYEAVLEAGLYSSGVYFYRLQSNGYSAIKKMILLK